MLCSKRAAEVDYAAAHGTVHGDLGVWPAALRTQDLLRVLVARWLLIAWASVLVLFLALMPVTQSRGSWAVPLPFAR